MNDFKNRFIGGVYEFRKKLFPSHYIIGEFVS